MIPGVSDPVTIFEFAEVVGVDWFVEDEGTVALGFRDHTCFPLSDPNLSTVEV